MKRFDQRTSVITRTAMVCITTASCLLFGCRTSDRVDSADLTGKKHANTQSNDNSAQVLTNWVVVTKPGQFGSCKTSIAKTGGKVLNAMPTINVLIVQTPSASPTAIEGLGCVAAVERDETVFTQNDASAQVLTEWLVTVHDGSSLKRCTSMIRKAGNRVTASFAMIDTLLVVTPSASPADLQNISCVASVEPNEQNTISVEGGSQDSSGAAIAFWLATVKSVIKLKQCATQIAKVGGNVTDTYETLGIIRFYTTTIAAPLKPKCAVAVEQEQTMDVAN